MRIAMFTNNYKPYMGGVPISIEHLALALREQGHEVYIFAPSHKNQQEEAYVIRYPSMPFCMAGAPIPQVITGVFEEKVLELGIEVIHVHHPVLVGNVALYLQHKYRIPVVYTYHTRFEAYLHYIRPLGVLERETGLVGKYLTWFGNQCDYLIAPTKGIQNYLEQTGVEKTIEVLPTGLPLTCFTPNEEQVRQIRSRFRQKADYLICTVARLAEEKNLLFQIRGLQRLKEILEQQQKSVRFLLIGDGPQRQELEREVKRLGLTQEVIFTGRIENEEIPDYLAACDLFVFSSKTETQGIVLLEAMAARLPIVAIKASGVEDIVEEGRTGLMTIEEEQSWAERILWLLRNPIRRKEMGDQGQLAAWQYEESRIAYRAVRVYQIAMLERERWIKQQQGIKTGWLRHNNVLN